MNINLFLIGASLIGGQALADVFPSDYKPVLQEPKFEVLYQIEPSSEFLWKYCPQGSPIDPRLKAGQIFTEVTEGHTENKASYFQVKHSTIVKSDPSELSYTYTFTGLDYNKLNKAFDITGSFDQKCAKQSDGKYTCLPAESKMFNAPAISPSDELSSEDWQPNGPSLNDKTTQELGYVTLASGDRTLAIRYHSNVAVHDGCSLARQGRNDWVRIETFNLPELQLSGICSALVFSKDSDLDEHGKVLSEYRSAIVENPNVKEFNAGFNTPNPMTFLQPIKK